MSETTPDEFHGVGGSYVVENGVRRCVEEATKDHPAGNRPRDADGAPLDAIGRGKEHPTTVEEQPGDAPDNGEPRC